MTLGVRSSVSYQESSKKRLVTSAAFILLSMLLAIHDMYVYMYVRYSGNGMFVHWCALLRNHTTRVRVWSLIKYFTLHVQHTSRQQSSTREVEDSYQFILRRVWRKISIWVAFCVAVAVVNVAVNRRIKQRAAKVKIIIQKLQRTCFDIS